MKRLFFGVTTLVVLASVTTVGAHTRSSSWSRWTLDARGADVELRVPLTELTRFPSGRMPSSYLPERLVLRAGSETCAPQDFRPVAGTPEGWAVFRWRIDCPGDGTRSIRSDLFREVTATHIHFVRLGGGEEPVRERVLVPADPVWTVESGPEETASGLGRMIRLGIDHILGGLDHVVFVVALLLLASSLRGVITLVTGFTVGHSLSLGLAVVGFVRPDAAGVEVLIGFSIALVAAENVWLLGRRDPFLAGATLVLVGLGLALSIAGSGRLAPLAWMGLAVFTAFHFRLLSATGELRVTRAGIAFAFGLVHGLGFAGALMELDLPGHRILPALFGFNVGVEVGQIAIVLLLGPALGWLAVRQPAWHRGVAGAGSAAILALGCFWVVSRGWG